MSDEQDKLKLSLEPPKLFGRKKKAAAAAGDSEPESAAPAPKTKPAAEPEPPTDEPELVEEPEPVVETEPETVVEAEPVVEEPAAVAAEPVVETEPEPVVEPVVEPDVAPDVAPDDEPTEVLVVEESAPEAGVPQEHAAWAPSTSADESATAVIDPVTAPEPDLTADPDPEPTAPLPSSDRTTKTRTPRIPGLTRTTKPVGGASATDPALVDPELVDPDREDAEIAAMAAQGPLLSAYRSAALTGLVVGAAMVVLTWLSLRGCEAVRGTSSCGGGPGFLLLIATFAVCVLLGSALLRAFDIPDPGSSSFLAVGLVAVVALLFLIDLLDHWSMLILIPVLSIGAYLASVWVTKTFVEPVET